MDMKKLMESLEECGMSEMPAMPAPEMDKGNPVTVNVSMNASGKEHVADLLDMMKNAGLGGAAEVKPDMMPMRMDMERLKGIMDEPEESIEEAADPKIASMIAKFVDEMDTDMMYYGEPDVAKVGELIKQGNIEDAAGEMADAMADQDGGSDKFDMVMQRAQEYIEDYMDNMGEGYANEPEAQYGDMSDAIPDGNDLNRKKKAYAKAQDGDNAMAVEAIKAQLMAALSEKKKPDANKNGIPDYAEDGKGPNDLAKGKKSGKPKKGVVPPQFKK